MAESEKISNSNKSIFSLCYAHTHEFQPIWFSHIYKRRALLYRDSFSDNSKILSSLFLMDFPPVKKYNIFREYIIPSSYPLSSLCCVQIQLRWEQWRREAQTRKSKRFLKKIFILIYSS